MEARLEASHPDPLPLGPRLLEATRHLAAIRAPGQSAFIPENETGTALPRSPVLTPRLPWQGMPPALFHRAGNGLLRISEGSRAIMSGKANGRDPGWVRPRDRAKWKWWAYSFGTRRCWVFSRLSTSLFRTLNSTRRFLERPSSVLLSAIGRVA